MAGGYTVISKAKFHTTINLGQVLAIATFMGAGMTAYTGIHVSIAQLQIELQHIDATIETLREVLMHSDDRLSAMEASARALETDMRRLQAQMRALNMKPEGIER